MSRLSSFVGATTPENRTAMPGSSRESPLDSLACCLARVRMACLPHQLTREKLAITRRKPKREPLKMNSKDASSENSFLKIELRVGEEKLQLALPTFPRMRGPRPRGAVVGTWWTTSVWLSLLRAPLADQSCAAARIQASHARRERRRDGGSAGFTADVIYRGAM